MTTVIQEVYGQRDVLRFATFGQALEYVRGVAPFDIVVEWGGRG